MSLHIKRIYEKSSEGDGQRVLVDRLWPRGLDKASAAIDLWLKDIAPSSQLRRWFAHDPQNWTEFRRRYHGELRANGVEVARLRELMKQGPVTLLYSARDVEHNQAVALRDFMIAQDS